MSSTTEPTPSEPEGTTKLAKSFEDRLTFPSDSASKPAPKDAAATDSTTIPSKFDWADEVTTPVQEKDPDGKAATESTGEKKDESSAGMAQLDGATTWQNGSPGLDEPEFDVNVKLADLQEDPNNPLYSAKSFDQLNL
jgi:ATP-dependent RNA helicase DDX19/DBP5